MQFLIFVIKKGGIFSSWVSAYQEHPGDVAGAEDLVDGGEVVGLVRREVGGEGHSCAQRRRRSLHAAQGVTVLRAPPRPRPRRWGARLSAGAVEVEAAARARAAVSGSRLIFLPISSSLALQAEVQQAESSPPRVWCMRLIQEGK